MHGIISSIRDAYCNRGRWSRLEEDVRGLRILSPLAMGGCRGSLQQTALEKIQKSEEGGESVSEGLVQ